MVTGPKSSHNFNKFDFIVVGNGIAARCLLREMAKDAKFQNKNILVLSKNSFLHSCSTHTTSVVCLSGIERGVSPLGDLIVDSYDLAKEYYESLDSSIVERAVQFQVKNDDQGRVSIRENKAYIIHPEKLLAQIEHEYKEILNITFKDDIVAKIENGAVLTLNNECYKSDRIIVAAGAWSNFLQKDIKCDDLNRSKFVSGSYLTFSNIDFGNEAFTYAYGHFNIIYRATTHELLIGGTTVKENIEAPSVAELEEQYKTFENLFKEIHRDKYVMPEFSKGKITTGMRHKGRKRTPFFGQVSEGLFLMSGLYKNGFSFPFYGAKKITSLL